MTLYVVTRWYRAPELLLQFKKYTDSNILLHAVAALCALLSLSLSLSLSRCLCTIFVARVAPDCARVLLVTPDLQLLQEKHHPPPTRIRILMSGRCSALSLSL